MHKKKVRALDVTGKENIKEKRMKNVAIPLNVEELAQYIAGGSV